MAKYNNYKYHNIYSRSISIHVDGTWAKYTSNNNKYINTQIEIYGSFSVLRGTFDAPVAVGETMLDISQSMLHTYSPL